MGLIRAPFEVSRDGGPRETVEFLIDSGAVYSVVPLVVWRRLGLKAKRSDDFRLIDGSVVTRKVSECRFRYEGVDAISPVILGGRHDEAIVGVVTLETLRLVLHPFERRLEPWRHPPLKTMRPAPRRAPAARAPSSPAA